MDADSVVSEKDEAFSDEEVERMIKLGHDRGIKVDCKCGAQPNVPCFENGDVHFVRVIRGTFHPPKP